MAGVTKETVNTLYQKFRDILEEAEQRDFAMLAVFDNHVTRLYNDLQVHWTDDHASLFCGYMRKMVLPYFGIKED